MRSYRHVSLVLLAGCAQILFAGNWPQWRGPNLNGVSEEKNLPVSWGRDENISWRLPLLGRSGSTAIVWDSTIFLNVADGDNIEVWAVNRADGSIRWKRTMGSGNYSSRKHNMSTPSPVTDGTTVWMMSGTGMLKAFDFDGNELWSRDIQADYGAFGLNWGYGSSPLLWEGALYVPVLHGMRTDDPSYVMKIDAATGETVWRTERPTNAIRESPDAYVTPALLQYDGHTEIVLNGGDVVTGHDAETGKELWRSDGLNPTNNPANRIVASTVVYDGIIYAPTRERPMLAIRAGGSGDITESNRIFSFNSGPDVPTPVTDGTYLYVPRDNGVMYCLNAKTGEQIYGGQRMPPATYSSSPILADGKIYISNEDGQTVVLRAGPEFEVLAVNDLGEYTLSTTAISDGQIFLRTDGALYAIGDRQE